MEPGGFGVEVKVGLGSAVLVAGGEPVGDTEGEGLGVSGGVVVVERVAEGREGSTVEVGEGEGEGEKSGVKVGVIVPGLSVEVGEELADTRSVPCRSSWVGGGRYKGMRIPRHKRKPEAQRADPGCHHKDFWVIAIPLLTLMDGTGVLYISWRRKSI